MTKKHALIMVACCLTPIVAFTLITTLNIPASGLLTMGLVLLCPISHLLLMKFMMPGHEEHRETAHQPVDNSQQIGHPATHSEH